MGWGFTTGEGGRDQGYIVPSLCDQPGCDEEIDRGLSYRCGEYRSDNGCDNFFCGKHLFTFWGDEDIEAVDESGDVGIQFCDHCLWGLEHPDDYDNPEQPPYHEPKPDLLKWVLWKRYDASWEQWREESPEDVRKLDAQINASVPLYVAGLMLELVPDMEQFQADDPVSDLLVKNPNTTTKVNGKAQS